MTRMGRAYSASAGEELEADERGEGSCVCSPSALASVGSMCASCAGSRLRLDKRRRLRSRGMESGAGDESVKTHMLALVQVAAELTLAELRSVYVRTRAFR